MPNAESAKTESKHMLIVLALIIFFVAQAIAWIQINGQFMSPWIKEHPLTMSLLGVPISYLLMLATNYAYLGMDSRIWPGRLLAFAVGIFVFTLFTAYFLKEGISLKTAISLGLSVILILIQLF